MSSKKVLFLIDTLNTGGAEKSLLDILPRFERYTPVVCHLYPGEQLKDKYIARGIEVHSLNIPPPYNFRRSIKAVRELVSKIQPALIHSSLFRSDIVSRIVASSEGIPLINSLINNSYHPSRFSNAGLMMKLKLRGVQFVDSITAGKVNLFISNSDTIKHSNAKALRIPLKKIEVIYRGRNADDFRNLSPEDIERARQELGVGSETVILNVSRLLDRKGQIDLLHAFKLLLREHSSIYLLIAGEGPHRKLIEHTVEDLNLSDRVKLLGNRSDIPKLLSLADYFVFPSHYEGLPGALIEAMMAKVPIVASRIPENLECVNESSATLHEPGNIQDLSQAIQSVMASSENTKYKALRAYNDALEKFELLSIVSQYEKTYDKLLTDL